MKRKPPLELQRLADEFNARYPVGTKVILRRDIGDVETTVTGGAFVLMGHSAVAQFYGVSGCYSIEDGRVRRC